MDDPTVHAESHQWQLVRYPRAGTWYMEWIGKGEPPSWVGPDYLGHHVNSNGRCRVYAKHLGYLAVNLNMTPYLNIPGGSTFDREWNRHSGPNPGDDDG